MIKKSKEDINPTNYQHNSVWNFLKNFDIFGITFNFRIETDEKFQSSTGGLWLIAFILLSIFLMINTIISYFNNPVFNSFYSEDALNFTDSHDQINFYKEKFDFGLTVVSKSGIFPNDTFIIKGFYTEKNNNTNYVSKRTELKQKDCNRNNFISDYNNTNKLSKDFLSRTTCFDLSNYTIKGSYFDDDSSYFVSEIQINKNSNLTQIEELMRQYPNEFQIIYPDVLVNSNDYSTFDASLGNIYDGLEVGTKKIIDFNVLRHEFEQDLGIIFSDKQTFIYLRYERSTFRSRIMNINSDGYPVIAVVNIRGLAYIKKNRKYITKLITVCQVQLTNLLNYLVLFKILATMINFKEAKKHLTKNFYIVDKNLINELRLHLKDDSIKKKINPEKENNFQKIQDSDKKYSYIDVNKKDIFVNSIEMNEKINKFEKNKTSLKQNLFPKNKEKNIIKENEQIINDNSTRINVDNKEIYKNEIKDNSTTEIMTKRFLLNNKVDEININFHEIKENLNNNDNSLVYKENNQEINKKNVSNINQNLDIPEDVDQKFKVYDKILDLTYFKKKMDEIELLKYLLFDEKSIYFFNFLAGKINPFDSIKNPYNFEDVDNRNFLIKNYDIKIKNNKNNFVEKKIIKLFEKFVINN